MLGSIGTSIHTYGNGSVSPSATTGVAVREPWDRDAVDDSVAALPVQAEEAAAVPSREGAVRGLGVRLAVTALAVSAAVGGTALMMGTGAHSADLMSFSQTTQTAHTMPVSTTTTTGDAFVQQAMRGTPVTMPMDSFTALLSYSGHAPQPDRGTAATQPMHVSYARPRVQHGDYVAHGVNFSALLSNEEFGDYNSLNRDQIQAFLEKNESFLADYTQDGRSAAQIIYDAAQQHRVNPRVILVTLEKENSLISRESTPRNAVLRSAMGYAYDDGGSTAGRHSNFAWQVDRGTELLRGLFDEGLARSYPAHLKVDFGHRSLQVDNAATYALMKYTPHTRDTQMRRVGGGNYLFSNVLERVNGQLDEMRDEAPGPRLLPPTPVPQGMPQALRT